MLFKPSYYSVLFNQKMMSLTSLLFSSESPGIAILKKLSGQLKFCGIAGTLPYPCSKG
jgi:hypothetical protein